MSSSGLIYATIIVLWAAVLVPMWLRRHDDVTESRSIDRFQGAMRTLSRRGSTGDRREVLVPRRGETHAVPDGAYEPPSPASHAAARRRLITTVLMAVSLLLVGLSVIHKVPVWAPAVPVLILAAFLLSARSSARKAQAQALAERRATAAEARRMRHEQVARTMGAMEQTPARDAFAASSGLLRRTPSFVDPAIVGRSTEIRRAPAAATMSPPSFVDPAVVGRTAEIRRAPAAAIVSPPSFVDPAVVGRTAEIRRPPVDTVAPAAATGRRSGSAASVDPEFYDGLAAAVWEPVPVPLPTYVSAPKAPRSVRIVDLTKAGAWTSGRLPDAPVVDDGAVEAEEVPAGAREGIVTGELLVERRAVGD